MSEIAEELCKLREQNQKLQEKLKALENRLAAELAGDIDKIDIATRYRETTGLVLCQLTVDFTTIRGTAGHFETFIRNVSFAHDDR